MRADINTCWRGMIAQGPGPKLDVLSRYKFCLGFENTSFPGYITEKIFDCFLAGTIPIYMGAPDILDYIPRSCFVDLRRFNNYDELGEYLNAFSASESKS